MFFLTENIFLHSDEVLTHIKTKSVLMGTNILLHLIPYQQQLAIEAGTQEGPYRSHQYLLTCSRPDQSFLVEPVSFKRYMALFTFRYAHFFLWKSRQILALPHTF